jgi:hypothetical protein
MERVINFLDCEDDNIYVETDNKITYFMSNEQWHTVDIPVSLQDNNIAKATYLLYYTEHFKPVSGDNQ